MSDCEIMKDIKEASVMDDKINKLNQKSKGEQLFILVALCTLFFGMMMISGCGGGNCVTPKCALKCSGPRYVGCQVPGCGALTGCLDCALMPEGVKAFAFSAESSGTEVQISALGEVYNSGSCGGCTSKLNGCYVGCVKIQVEGEKAKERLIGGASTQMGGGCFVGCFGCMPTCTSARDIDPMYELAVEEMELY